MYANELRRMLEAGVISQQDLQPNELAMLMGGQPQQSPMPQPRYDIAPMQANTMRFESGPDQGRVVNMDFRQQAQQPAPMAQAPVGDELQRFRATAAKQGILTNADLEAFMKTGRAPQRPQTAQNAPQQLGAPVEVVGKGKGRYSPDGRSVVFADGSTQDLHPEASMQAFLDSFQKKKADLDLRRGEQDLQQGDLGMAATRQQMRLAAQPKEKPAPAGYRWKGDGTMERIPGGPADDKETEAVRKKEASAADTLSLLDEAEKLLPAATESLAGTGVDALLGAFGKATPGAQATAQLKTIQGQLVAKMPRMEGPQSNYDVKLYQEMAGQLADSTIPMESRMAALQTVRKLNEKYSPVQATRKGTLGAPAGAPQPGEVRKGYQFKGGDPSNPSSWMKVQ